ncbi:MAG: hypothetical protein ACRDHK_12220, partial [Actinomycetota bacterium]
EAVLTASGTGDGVNIGADLFGVKTAPPAPDPAQGGGDGVIDALFLYDRNSLLAAWIDDNGNRTDYFHDNLDRRIATSRGTCVPPSLADRCDPVTTTVFFYDRDHNLSRLTDEIGSVLDGVFDAINRRSAVFFTGGPAVVGTTVQSFQYNADYRLTRATGDNDPADATEDSAVEFSWDSLGRLIEERQEIGSAGAKAVSSAWRAENLRSAVTYPNGRVVEHRFDGLDRLNSLSSTGVLAQTNAHLHIGPHRTLERRELTLNGTRMTYLNDSGTAVIGYDGLRRPVLLRHLRADNSLIVGLERAFDRMGNPIQENKLHDPANSETYGFDSAYRLTRFERVNPMAIPPLHGTWELDGVGNWKRVDAETRMHSSFNEIIERNAGVPVPILSDDNGNEIDDGVLLHEYDARNRLVRVTRKSDGLLIAEYDYDAFGRRLRKA